MRLGESDLSNRNTFVKDYEVESFIEHQSYNPGTHYNDIALIKLKNNVTFSKNVRPACLHQNINEILMHQHAIAIGFGRTDFDEDPSEILLKVNLTVLHPNQCKNVNEGRKLQSQLCLKGDETESGSFADTCQGDKNYSQLLYLNSQLINR